MTVFLFNLFFLTPHQHVPTMVQNQYYASHYQPINMGGRMASSVLILLQMESLTSKEKQRT
jgi:hypothetical protein